ncbi:MAG: hypothetical protein HYY45_21330 [Deltaproteobacteria bacterium]|nr:hypothetical protein [Deltaproteobacteria bacterium]
MYGWRGRIGYISAGTGEVAGQELFRAAPKGVETLHGNLFLKEEGPTEIEVVPAALEDMAERLAKRAEVDMLVVAGYFLPALAQRAGVGDPLSSETEWISHLEGLAGRPVITGIRAQVEAMQSREVRRPVVVVPGPADSFLKLRGYLRASGFEVASLQGMDISAYAEPYLVPLHVSYRFAKEAFLDVSQADALLLPESSFPFAANVATLERDLGAPVFLDSLCSLWSCLRRLHIRDSVSGWGGLFEKA